MLPTAENLCVCKTAYNYHCHLVDAPFGLI